MNFNSLIKATVKYKTSHRGRFFASLTFRCRCEEFYIAAAEPSEAAVGLDYASTRNGAVGGGVN